MDTYAIQRPSGEIRACPSLNSVASTGNAFAPLDVLRGSGNAQMSLLPFLASGIVKKMKRPSRDQLVGVPGWSRSGRSSPDPSAGLMYNFGDPERFDENTMNLPSGDHTGLSSLAGSNVKRVVVFRADIQNPDVASARQAHRDGDARLVRRQGRVRVVAALAERPRRVAAAGRATSSSAWPPAPVR